jgi:outer membrane receptor protein involved in Fe transport
MSELKLSARAALLATTIVAAIATSAKAQQLEEIVVTARKTTENLQDIPLTITAFTSDMIARQNIRSAQDVVKFTPGLNYDKGFAAQDTRISIRGLPVVRGKPPVGILLDGIDISSESISTAGGSALVNVKLVDLENIAVVKGPQSALYGRSAFGGAVVYTSKKPNLNEFEASGQLDVATHDMFEVRAALSVPVVEDKVAVRVNGVYSYFNGFHRNTITNATIGGDEFAGASVQVRFTPAENVDFTYRISYSDDQSENRPSYYLGVSNGKTELRALPANAIGLRLGLPPGGAPLPAVYPFSRIGRINVKDNVIRLSVDPLTNEDLAGGRLRPVVNSLVGEINLGDLTLSSWTGYVNARAFGKTDADFYGFPVGPVTVPSAGTAEQSAGMFISDIEVKANQFSQELRLAQDEGRLRWAIGALYWEENYKSDNASLSVTVVGRPAGFSAARAYQILGQAPRDRSARFTEHTSGYGSVTFDFTDQIEGNVEARYAHEKVDSIFGRALNLALAPVTFAPSYVFGTILNPRPSYTTNMFTPRAVLRYRLNDDDSIYASFSKGMKPGGYLNVGAVNDANLNRYNPEKIFNYEIGFKSSWADNRVNINGAVFESINKDRINTFLVPDATSPQGAVTAAGNIGEVKIDGAELEIAAALAEGLTGQIGYTYLNARYTDSDVPQTAPFGIAGPQKCRVANVGPQVVCIVNTNGNRVDFSSRHSASASLTYTALLTSDWNFNSSVDVQMRSSRFLDATNLFLLPSFWNVDVHAGIDSEQYSATFYVTNLFNDQKAKSGQTTGDVFSLTPPQLMFTAYAADKRQIGLRLGAKF